MMPLRDLSPEKNGAEVIAHLYPRIGLTTIDSTIVRYDPSRKAAVVFVMKDTEGVEIAYDMCGACHLFITSCPCPNGPSEPPYIYRLRTGEPFPAGAIRPTGLPKQAQRVSLSSEAEARIARRKREHAVPFVAPERRSAPLAEATAAPVLPKVLTAPCGAHTAESRLNADGTYTCTVAGCLGVE